MTYSVMLGSSATQDQCKTCGKSEQQLRELDLKLQRCAKCRIACYCTVGCQRKDWPEHRKVCKAPATVKESPAVDLHNFLNSRYSQVFTVRSGASSSPKLTQEQVSDARKLLVQDLESILDEDKGEAACKKLGQEFFDKYKKAGGSSMSGKRAVQNICDWVKFNVKDGSLRKQYIERAWHGIGDSTWRWMA